MSLTTPCILCGHKHIKYGHGRCLHMNCKCKQLETKCSARKAANLIYLFDLPAQPHWQCPKLIIYPSKAVVQGTCGEVMWPTDETCTKCGTRRPW